MSIFADLRACALVSYSLGYFAPKKPPSINSATPTHYIQFSLLQPPTPASLQTRFTLALKGEDEHQETGRDEQGATNVDRYARLQIRKHGDDGRHDAEDAVRRRGDGVAGAAVFGGEDLGRVRVEDGVHYVGHEVVGAVPGGWLALCVLHGI